MSEEIKGFETIEELAAVKTRKEIIEWAAEFGKCPWDYQLPSIAESECLQGQGEDGAKQCDKCWEVALKDIKCKGDEEQAGRRSRTRVNTQPQQEVQKDDLHEEKEPDIEGLRSLCAGLTKTEFLKDIGDKKLCCKDSGFPNAFDTQCLGGKTKKQCQDCWMDVIEKNNITFKQGRTRNTTQQVKEEKPKVEPRKALYEASDNVDFKVNNDVYTGNVVSVEWINDSNMYTIKVDDVLEPFYVYELDIIGVHIKIQEDKQEDSNVEDHDNKLGSCEGISDLIKPLILIAQSLKEISDNSFEIRKALSQMVDNQNKVVGKK